MPLLRTPAELPTPASANLTALVLTLTRVEGARPRRWMWQEWRGQTGVRESLDGP